MFTQDEIEARLGMGRKRLVWQVVFLAPCCVLLGLTIYAPWIEPVFLFLPFVAWWMAGIGVAYLMTPGASRAPREGPDPAEFL